MSAEIVKQIDELQRMTVRELRVKYSEVFGEETKVGNKDWLWKRIAWRIQELKFGGLSERAKQRAAEIVNEADLRVRWPKGAFDDGGSCSQIRTVELSKPRDPRLPNPGTILRREYRGRSIIVTVLENRFLYEGEIYKSLSAVARAATGVKWNGFLFFGIE